MSKNIVFYGTPLSKVLNNHEDSNRDGPINSRRARLGQQQVVKDEQGRRRFHGAFTGGFTAGYYNTVDSVEGFRPKQYVTHRKDKRDNGESSSSTANFTQRPEDFMDEEDLGEFGIAPKKIRVNEGYGESSFAKLNISSDKTSLLQLIQPTSISVGEKILKTLNATYGFCHIEEVPNSLNYEEKNDFHGLGYKPIQAKQSTIGKIKPLKATIDKGKRLEISGEAFGSGVLDDDEDFLDNIDAYGHDDINNYEFGRSKREKETTKTCHEVHESRNDVLHGFELAVSNDSSEGRKCDNFQEPQIPDSWNAPTRDQPYIPPSKTSINSSYGSSNKISLDDNLFSKKFTTSSEYIKSNNTIEKKAGLLSYKDLKETESSPTSVEHEPSSEPGGIVRQATKITIKRQILEWRPCSLLCKRYNVSNPYPDGSFCGVNQDIQPSDTNLGIGADQCSTSDWSNNPRIEAGTHRQRKLASMDLKRSIFNIAFKRTSEITMIDSDESDQDSDVLVVATSKQEPELVVISDSSSSSYGPPMPSRRKKKKTKTKSKKSKRHKKHG